MSLLLLGVLAQAYRPKIRSGALHTSLVIWSWFCVFFTIGEGFEPIFVILFLLLLGMAIVHPAGKEQLPDFSSFAVPLGYFTMAVAVVAFIVAGNEVLAHLTLADSHVMLGHYLFMATASASVGTLLIRGSFTEHGWRFPLYAGVAIMLVFGLASITFPGAEQGSSAGRILGVVVVVIAILTASIAEGVSILIFQ